MGRLFGFQKVWSRSSSRLASVRGEVVNTQVHHSERFDRLRAYGPITLPLYWHGQVRQGHTHAGQLLSSPTAYGGAGWTIGVDLYNTEGRWTVDFFRALNTDFSSVNRGTQGPGISDVIYGMRLEMMRFHTGTEWLIAVTPSVNLNRNLVHENDVFNLGLALRIAGLPW